MSRATVKGPWKVKREKDASGWRGISIFCGDVAVANIVMQLDEREMEHARFIVESCNRATAPAQEVTT